MTWLTKALLAGSRPYTVTAGWLAKPENAPWFDDVIDGLYLDVTVVARNTDAQNTNATTFTIDVPGYASRQAGDVAIICVSKDGSGGLPANPTESGWTRMAEAGSSANRGAVYMRRLTGTDADTATITLTATSENWIARGWLLRGVHPTLDPEIATATSAAAQNANPPALNPTNWDGVQNTLWIYYVAFDGDPNVTGHPSGWTNTGNDVTSDGTAGNRCRQSYGERVEAIDSQDPAQLTSTSEDQVLFTIGARPADAA